MRELFDEILALLAEQPVALARIVDRTGAGPRDTGTAMAVAADGRVIGSLSGGCVEAAVVTTAKLRTVSPAGERHVSHSPATPIGSPDASAMA